MMDVTNQREVAGMKKRMGWTTAAVILMIGFPWLAVTFAGDAGMAVCFVLFFAVNPLFSAVCGFAARKDTRRLWMLPLVTTGLFLAGTWIFFDMGEPAFLLYGAVYLAIGAAAMLLRAVWKWKKG